MKVRQRKSVPTRGSARVAAELRWTQPKEEQEMMTDVKYPDVEVKLTGTDGNVFSIIGAVSRALKKAGHRDAATEFSNEAMEQESYDAVLRLVMRTVEVS